MKQVAALLSGGAALVSILSFVTGRRNAPEVDRLEVRPAADTAFALGDTLELTVLAADARGVSVVPSRIQWQAEDSTVALADSSGRVRALGRGQTLVTVAAGGRMARARIWVLPRVTELLIAADSVIRVPEGGSQRLHVVARDARGNRVPAAGLRWTVADPAIAVVDSSGELHALAFGSTTVSATVSDQLAQRRIEVIAVPSSLTLSGGAEQRAAAGELLPVPLAVQVVSRSGRPVPQAAVRFNAAASGGFTSPDTSWSDSAGLARVRWTLGPRPGRQQMLVSVSGVDSPLVATAEADPVPVATDLRVEPDTLAGQVLEPLPRALVVRLTDTSGVSLAGVPVAWSTLDGGEVVALSARTDSQGVVQGRWTLGRQAGPQRLHLQVGNPRTFPHRILTAEARPAPPARLELVSGNGQRGTAGNLLSRDVVLRVKDSLGNPVPGASVRLTRTGQPASDTMIRSGKDGRVIWRWTLPRVAGRDGFMARLPDGADSVRLAAIVRPGAVDTIGFVSPPVSAVAGKVLPRPVELRAADRFGNPVPGAAIGVSTSSGRVTPARVVTDSLGRAVVRWTPGPTGGPQTLTASVAGRPVRARHSVQVTAPASTRSTGASRPRTGTKRAGSGSLH